VKITAIETIYLTRGITVHAGPIQWLWVRIHTDEGITGLGETYPHPETEAAAVRRLAPVLLGRDPLQIDRLWADMFLAVSYSGWGGAELRATLPERLPVSPYSNCSVALPGVPSAHTTRATTTSISIVNPSGWRVNFSPPGSPP
jgi:hypothetical protein